MRARRARLATWAVAIALSVGVAGIVAILLLITYRSPWLWLVPLVVVGVAEQLTTKVVALLAPHFGIVVGPEASGITSVLVFGAAALYSGVRRRFPRYGSFLGHTRFSNYFMIAIYPMQAHALRWTWERLAAIVLFAVPIWLILHFGLMPLRRK